MASVVADPKRLSECLITLRGKRDLESFLDCLETRGFANPEWRNTGQYEGRKKRWERLINGEQDKNGKWKERHDWIDPGAGPAFAIILLIALCGSDGTLSDGLKPHMRGALSCWVGSAPEPQWGGVDLWADHFLKMYEETREDRLKMTVSLIRRQLDTPDDGS